MTTAGATSRSVYPPAGTWYDSWTGETTDGGSKVTADAPLSRIDVTATPDEVVSYDGSPVVLSAPVARRRARVMSR